MCLAQLRQLAQEELLFNSLKKGSQRGLIASPRGQNGSLFERGKLTVTLLLWWVALLTWVLLLRRVTLLLGRALLICFLLLTILGITFRGQ